MPRRRKPGDDAPDASAGRDRITIKFAESEEAERAAELRAVDKQRGHLRDLANRIERGERPGRDDAAWDIIPLALRAMALHMAPKKRRGRPAKIYNDWVAAAAVHLLREKMTRDEALLAVAGIYGCSPDAVRKIYDRRVGLLKREWIAPGETVNFLGVLLMSAAAALISGKK